MSDAEDDYFGADNGIDDGIDDDRYESSEQELVDARDILSGRFGDAPDEVVDAAISAERAHERREQRPVTSSDHVREMLAHLFDVPPEYVGPSKPSTLHSFAPDIAVRTSPAVPPGTGYLFALDPSRSDSALVRAPVPVRLNWLDPNDFPSYKKFTEKYGAGLKTYAPKTVDTKGKHTMDMAGIAAARRDLEEMLAKVAGMVAVVERFGGEPAEGTVLKFEHTFATPGQDGKTTYDYVAVRKFNAWYATGRKFAGKAVGWSELLEFIGDGRAWICREFEEVPLPGSADDDTASANLAAAFADVLSSTGGRDVKDVAAELAALVKDSK